jgi:hypothetical protein
MQLFSPMIYPRRLRGWIFALVAVGVLATPHILFAPPTDPKKVLPPPKVPPTKVDPTKAPAAKAKLGSWWIANGFGKRPKLNRHEARWDVTRNRNQPNVRKTPLPKGLKVRSTEGERPVGGIHTSLKPIDDHFVKQASFGTTAITIGAHRLPNAVEVHDPGSAATVSGQATQATNSVGAPLNEYESTSAALGYDRPPPPPGDKSSNAVAGAGTPPNGVYENFHDLLRLGVAFKPYDAVKEPIDTTINRLPRQGEYASALPASGTPEKVNTVVDKNGYGRVPTDPKLFARGGYDLVPGAAGAGVKADIASQVASSSDSKSNVRAEAPLGRDPSTSVLRLSTGPAKPAPTPPSGH